MYRCSRKEYLPGETSTPVHDNGRVLLPEKAHLVTHKNYLEVNVDVSKGGDIQKPEEQNLTHNGNLSISKGLNGDCLCRPLRRVLLERVWESESLLSECIHGVGVKTKVHNRSDKGDPLVN